MLEIRDLQAGYGAITVLWGLSLDIPRGQLTAIVGPNGAGKTTLFRAITGLIPHRGTIQLDGRALASSTWDLAEKGIVMVPEGRMIFKDISVEENLTLGAYPRRCRNRQVNNLERVYALFPRLKERRSQLAGSLSGGEAQMLAMGRGLMGEPDILLIDEPSLGLAPVIVKEVFGIIRLLRAEGVTIALIEQNTHLAVAVADHVHLMRGGNILLSQPAAGLDIDRLHDLYLARQN